MERFVAPTVLSGIHGEYAATVLRRAHMPRSGRYGKSPGLSPVDQADLAAESVRLRSRGTLLPRWSLTDSMRHATVTGQLGSAGGKIMGRAVGRLFPAMEIRDAVGELADGHSIDPQLVQVIRTAVAGLCPTSDRGEQQFVIDISGCSLLNVDTDELIWPRDPGGDCGDDDVPLSILSDRDLWERTRSRWDEERPRQWVAFVWRIAVPLSRRLELSTAGW